MQFAVYGASGMCEMGGKLTEDAPAGRDRAFALLIL